MEEVEEVETNGFHHHHCLSPHRNNHRHHHHFTIFPPVNHEGLPIPPLPPPPQTPPSFLNSNPDSSPSPNPPPSHFVKWFDFALHLWNSKLISFFTLFRSSAFFSSLVPLASTASFLGFLWFFVRRRWRLRSSGGKDNVEHLKRVIKEKDEKIVQLLEQIAQLNKVLLARYMIPVMRAS